MSWIVLSVVRLEGKRGKGVNHRVVNASIDFGTFDLRDLRI
jgi:hypothetical protein